MQNIQRNTKYIELHLYQDAWREGYDHPAGREMRAR